VSLDFALLLKSLSLFPPPFSDQAEACSHGCHAPPLLGITPSQPVRFSRVPLRELSVSRWERDERLRLFPIVSFSVSIADDLAASRRVCSNNAAFCFSLLLSQHNFRIKLHFKNRIIESVISLGREIGPPNGGMFFDFRAC